MPHKKEHVHIIMMTLACLIPFVLVSAISFLGISSKFTIMAIVILMIVLHIIVMKHHFRGHGKNKGDDKSGE
ncbi:hypothetical protein J4425_00340 [Candidatus Woesearchaeota archaeon]|nr:hypothetical protein [Candidatus Woesearchaeota archaeon]